MTQKYWSDMELNELTQELTRELLTSFVEKGGLGLKSCVRELLVDIATNVEHGGYKFIRRPHEIKESELVSKTFISRKD